MATSKAELALILSLVDDVSKTAKGVRGNLLDLGRTSGGVQGMLVGLGKIGFGAIVAGGALAVGAVTAVGAASFAAAMEIDNAMDTINIGTGAAGERLTELRGILEDVASNTHTGATIDVISGALTALDAKLDLTNPDLRALTMGITELSQLTGGDATKNAEAYARVLGDWAVPAEQGAALLDKMFVATQNSGIGFDRLSTLMVQYGSPMRLMGFTVEDSIALLSKWEKEGVNTELVMGSLRIAAGKFAKAGKPLRESLLETFETIQNTTDASEALALGMEIFGARAGPDMTAAIREGRFAIDDLVAMMGNAEGAIEDAAQATEDWPEKLARAKNRITTILAPIGEALMNVAGKGIDYVMPMFDDLAGLVETHVLPAIEKIGPALDIFFQGLEQGRGPVEAFKDVLWKLLPPDVAATVTGVITKLQELVTKIKEGKWSEVGADLWGMIRTGFEGAIAFGADLAEAARQKLATALGLSTSHDVGAGSDNTTWSGIGTAIAQSIVNGVRTFFASTVAQVTEASQSFLRWSQAEDTQEDLRQAGANLADALMDGWKGGITEGLIQWHGFPKAEEVPVLNFLRGAWNVVNAFGSGIPAMGDLQFEGSALPGNAGGTDYWRGGPTWVGERGPEIVVPPQGSRIVPADASARAAGGTTVNIQPGAIVIYSMDPRSSGDSVIARLEGLGLGFGGAI